MKEPTAETSGRFNLSFRTVFNSDTSINVSFDISFTRFSILGEALLADSGNGIEFCRYADLRIMKIEAE